MDKGTLNNTSLTAVLMEKEKSGTLAEFLAETKP
jgi:hypothetical protein